MQPDLSAYKFHYKGCLELYYETGMEGHHAPILHDDRGLHEGEHHDQKNHKGEKFMYHSLAWSHWFDSKLRGRKPDFLRVFDKEGKVVFEGIAQNDKAKSQVKNYQVTFVPELVERTDWIKWVVGEYPAEVWTDKPVSAQEDDKK